MTYTYTVNPFANGALSAGVSLLYGNSVPLSCTTDIFITINTNVLKNYVCNILEITIKDYNSQCFKSKS